ncbi:hypothetical protein GW937_01760 [Candidatus Kaiserbacteria bacterium]|nr:hypothetical protein [Candidatus Kaiserbacteria bacterium]NCT02316.1 hypothetical protein [Candidatus Parcubacteria bacterium]
MTTREQGIKPNAPFSTKSSVTYTNQSTQRRTGSDRSDLQQKNQIRNVRTSTMPGSNRATLSSAQKTTDQTFNETYAKKGLQPSSLSDNNDERYSAGRRYEPIKQVEKRTIPEEAAESAFYEEQKQEEEIQNLQRNVKKKKTTLSTARRVTARIKASSVNTSIWSWGLYSWLFFQLPFAILGLIILVAAAAVEALITSITAPEEDDGVIMSLAKGAVNFVVEGVASLAKSINDNVLSLFNVDLTSFNPASFFIVPYGLVLAYGIFLLLLMYLVYKLAFLEPLSGEGGGAKKGALLLAIIGYSVPGLNLFPWFMVWTFAVWRYPK